MTHSIIFSASYSLKPQSVLRFLYTYQQYFSLWTHPPFRLYLQACLLTSHAHLQPHLLARQFCLFTIKLLNLLSVSVCCVCLGPPCCFKEQRHVLNFKINTSLCEFSLVSEVRAVIDESVKVSVLMRRLFNTHQPEYGCCVLNGIDSFWIIFGKKWSYTLFESTKLHNLKNYTIIGYQDHSWSSSPFCSQMYISWTKCS